MKFLIILVEGVPKQFSFKSEFVLLFDQCTVRHMSRTMSIDVCITSDEFYERHYYNTTKNSVNNWKLVHNPITCQYNRRMALILYSHKKFSYTHVLYLTQKIKIKPKNSLWHVISHSLLPKEHNIIFRNILTLKFFVSNKKWTLF